MEENAQEQNIKKEVGDDSYLNKNCWLVNNLNYPPYKRCQYCEFKFRHCLFLKYQIISVLVIIISFSIFLIVERKLSWPAILTVFTLVMVYGYFFNNSTESIIKSNFHLKMAKNALKELTDKLQETVDEQTADIRAKSEHLAKLMAMRSEFLDIASHQLRTPVAVIKGMLSMMKEGSVPKDKVDFFMNGALQKSFKLSEIIDEILRASELDSDRFELTLKPIDIIKLLDDIVLEKRMEAKNKNDEVVFDKPKGDFPLVMSDDKYIKHVITNLVNNSIQYTKDGKIEIRLSQENNSVVIRVIDNGIGIPKEDLPKLFQKFSRAKNAVDTYTDGSGLGLFIIKQIIEYHPGAKIEIEKTEVGNGTTFAITLPLAQS